MDYCLIIWQIMKAHPYYFDHKFRLNNPLIESACMRHKLASSSHCVSWTLSSQNFPLCQSKLIKVNEHSFPFLRGIALSYINVNSAFESLYKTQAILIAALNLLKFSKLPFLGHQFIHWGLTINYSYTWTHFPTFILMWLFLF